MRSVGIGFTISLAALGAVREVLGSGNLTVVKDVLFFEQVFGPSFPPFDFMVQAPGAFVALGLMLCVMNLFGK